MKLKTALLGCTAAMTFTVAANAGELRGTYFALEAGASWVANNGAFQSTTGATTTSALFAAEFDTGWAVMGSVGYAFSNGLRAELEAGYRTNDIDRLTQVLPTTGAVPPAGELGEFTVMANLLYDLRLTDRVTVSIGAGAGVDRAKLKIAAIGFEDDDWVFAYQGIAGLNYAIGDRTQLFLNYRYLRADTPEYAAAIGGPSTQRTTLTDDLEKHAVTLGVRFALEGEAAPPPPPPAPPAPPPPPPPAPPPQFIVFFGLDSAVLVPEAQRVVADAAQAAKEFGAASLSIVGHTDSSGSTTYNQRLSERRAAAVREALTQSGIPADKISASGQGEGDLIVRTGDGVKEPQNRRATINLQ